MSIDISSFIILLIIASADFTFLLLAALSLYHLFFVKKTRRWLASCPWRLIVAIICVISGNRSPK